MCLACPSNLAMMGDGCDVLLCSPGIEPIALDKRRVETVCVA